MLLGKVALTKEYLLQRDDAEFAKFADTARAKNFDLYGERVGAFSVTCGSSDTVNNVMSQLGIIFRNLCSNPPKHGANIVKTVLSSRLVSGMA